MASHLKKFKLFQLFLEERIIHHQHRRQQAQKKKKPRMDAASATRPENDFRATAATTFFRDGRCCGLVVRFRSLRIRNRRPSFIHAGVYVRRRKKPPTPAATTPQPQVAAAAAVGVVVAVVYVAESQPVECLRSSCCWFDRRKRSVRNCCCCCCVGRCVGQTMSIFLQDRCGERGPICLSGDEKTNDLDRPTGRHKSLSKGFSLLLRQLPRQTPRLLWRSTLAQHFWLGTLAQHSHRYKITSAKQV